MLSPGMAKVTNSSSHVLGVSLEISAACMGSPFGPDRFHLISSFWGFSTLVGR